MSVYVNPAVGEAWREGEQGRRAEIEEENVMLGGREEVRREERR